VGCDQLFIEMDVRLTLVYRIVQEAKALFIGIDRQRESKPP
jgi:hypothetical protein